MRMKTTTTLLISLLVIIFGVTMAVHATARNVVTLQGVVSADSKPVSNAFVMFRGIRDEGVWEARTETNGTLTLNVGVGCYHVFASAEGFFPVAERFCVKFESDTPKLSLKLKRDPLRYGVLD